MALLKTNVQTNVSRRLTGRRVRERQFALSCPPRPPRSLVFCAQFPSLTAPSSRSGFPQRAIPVIAVNPRMIDERTCRPEDISGWKTRRELARELRRLRIAVANRLSVKARPHARRRVELAAKEAYVYCEKWRVHRAHHRATA